MLKSIIIDMLPKEIYIVMPVSARSLIDTQPVWQLSYDQFAQLIGDINRSCNVYIRLFSLLIHSLTDDVEDEDLTQEHLTSAVLFLSLFSILSPHGCIDHIHLLFTRRIIRIIQQRFRSGNWFGSK